MPYIPDIDRGRFKPALDAIVKAKLTVVQIRNLFTFLSVEKLKLPVQLASQLADLSTSDAKEIKNILDLLKREEMNEGDLNYFFTEVMANYYIDTNGKKYKVLNVLEGMLDKVKDEVLAGWQGTADDEELELVFRGLIGCCRKELYRVITGPYEDEKINDPANGPVVKSLATLGQTKDY